MSYIPRVVNLWADGQICNSKQNLSGRLHPQQGSQIISTVKSQNSKLGQKSSKQWYKLIKYKSVDWICNLIWSSKICKKHNSKIKVIKSVLSK